MSVISLATAFLYVFYFQSRPKYLELNKLNKEEAVAKIKSLPEVKEYLKRVPNGSVLVSSDENNEFMIQVFEIKNGHTATFNWYYVNKITGEIRKEF